MEKVQLIFYNQYLSNDVYRKNSLISLIVSNKFDRFPRTSILNTYFDLLHDTVYEFFIKKRDEHLKLSFIVLLSLMSFITSLI